MDPRQFIKRAAEDETYFVSAHCLEEMDKDSLSPEQVERVMVKGAILKQNVRRGRYTLGYDDIMISVEIASVGGAVKVVTAGRQKGR